MKKLIIDPPEGWRYGFPKVYDNPDNLSVAEWLVENGYPQEELAKYVGNTWCRYWDAEETEEDDNENID